MALSDLAVFSEQLFTTSVEILDQQVELFNQASQGAIVLASRPFAGDYSESSFFAQVAGIVRRRNPYADNSIAHLELKNVIETMVKVGAGSKELGIDPGMFNWIKENPELAAATWAIQMAPQILADMLGIAIGALYAAQSQVTSMKTTAAAGEKLTLRSLNKAASKMGDRSGDIVAWIMHSTPFFDLIDANLQNSASLFSFGTVNIQRDALGRPFVVSDQPGLFTAGTPGHYHMIGAKAGAVVVNTNDDFDDITVGQTGRENIKRNYQAEWSYNVGVMGFTWDKTNGGKAPTDAALLTATNWDKIVTSDRDTAGVILDTE